MGSPVNAGLPFATVFCPRFFPSTRNFPLNTKLNATFRKAAPISKLFFSRVKLRATFVVDGVTYIKISPRRGMTADGKMAEFVDTQVVTLPK